MEDLPTEIRALIGSFMSDSSLLAIKQTNRTWHKLIKCNRFKIYGTTSESLPQLIDTYSKIPTPIGLHFKKNYVTKIGEFADQLTRLTNLTDLRFDDTLARGDEDKNWFKLAPLTSITSFEVNWRAEYPFELLEKFTKLRSFSYTQLPYDFERWAKILRIEGVLRKLPDLEQLIVSLHQGNFDPFSLHPNPSNLSRLILTNHSHTSNMVRYEPSKVQKFYNLKVLKLTEKFSINTSGLTALESLTIHSNDINSLENNTNLTKLSVKCNSLSQELRSSIALLGKLKVLEINQYGSAENANTVQFDCLTLLTRLEHLTVSTNVLFTGELFSKMESNAHLTALRWTFKTDANMDYIKELTSLRLLVLTQEGTDPKINYDSIRSLTNLTCLRFMSKNATSQSLRSINELTNIHSLYISHMALPGDLDLIKLTNLKSLETSGNAQKNSLHGCSSTRLKYLRASMSLSSDCDALLNNFGIEDLTVENEIKPAQFWHVLAQLTHLTSLSLAKIDNRLYGITTLTNLKILTLALDRKFDKRNLKLFPSLKRIYCKDKLVYQDKYK